MCVAQEFVETKIEKAWREDRPIYEKQNTVSFDVFSKFVVVLEIRALQNFHRIHDSGLQNARADKQIGQMENWFQIDTTETHEQTSK